MSKPENKPLSHNELSEIETALQVISCHLRQQIEEQDPETLELAAQEWGADITDEDGEPFSPEEVEAWAVQRLADNEALITRVQKLQRYCEVCGLKRELFCMDDLILCEECADKYEQAQA